MYKRKIRILYIVNFFVSAGTENYVLSLINNLNRDIFQPFLYILYSYDEEFFKKVKTDVNIQIFSKKKGYDLSELKKIIRQFSKDKIDLIHVNNWGTFFDGAMLKFFFPKVSLVHVQHGLEYGENQNADPIKQNVRYLLRKMLINVFTMVISVSKAGRNFLKIKWGAKQVVVLYNGIDTKRFSDDSLELKDDNSDEDNFTICTVGRFAAVKNFICLFKAINILKTKITNIKLLHIGADVHQKGKIHDELITYIQKENLENNVEFLGKVNNVEQILKSCKLFTLTSFSEAISLALLEAQSFGLPAIVTNVGGNPEVVQNGVNGFLVESNNEVQVADAIYSLYKDPKLRLRMSNNAKRIAREKFDVVSMIRNYEDVYLKCI